MNKINIKIIKHSPFNYLEFYKKYKYLYRARITITKENIELYLYAGKLNIYDNEIDKILYLITKHILIENIGQYISCEHDKEQNCWFKFKVINKDILLKLL